MTRRPRAAPDEFTTLRILAEFAVCAGIFAIAIALAYLGHGFGLSGIE